METTEATRVEAMKKLRKDKFTRAVEAHNRLCRRPDYKSLSMDIFYLNGWFAGYRAGRQSAKEKR